MHIFKIFFCFSSKAPGGQKLCLMISFSQSLAESLGSNTCSVIVYGTEGAEIFNRAF